MKRYKFSFMIFIWLAFLVSCAPVIHHEDPFYDLNGEDYPRGHIPLIKPVQVTRDVLSTSWNIDLLNVIRVDLPKSNENEVPQVYVYGHVTDLKKIAVQDGVVMAYSEYIHPLAEGYLRENYYHWFVIAPEKDISVGFQTEEEFNQYIQTLGIEDPDWLDPDEVHDAYWSSGGCLEWIPDC